MGGGLGRHLQPAARDHFSLRGTVELAQERYAYYDDGQRRGSWSRTRTQVGSSHCLVQDTDACCHCVVCGGLLRPQGVLFRIEITANGMRRLRGDDVLRALDANGWIRYSGPLYRGVTVDDAGDIVMTVTAQP